MQSIQLLSDSNYRIAGNFWGIKFSQIFMILWLFAKVFPAKFRGMVSFDTAKRSNPRKFSPRKSFFFTNSRKFSPSKVFHYTIHHLVTMDLNSKHIIFEQVCLREHQILGAKDSHCQLIFGLGEWKDSKLGCTLGPHAVLYMHASLNWEIGSFVFYMLVALTQVTRGEGVWCHKSKSLG